MRRKQDRRRVSREARAELRAQVLALRREGRTYEEISRVTGYVRPYCVKLVQMLGDSPDLARTVKPGGRPRGVGRTLSAKQEAQVLRWVIGRCPDRLLLPFVLWTRRAVQELIRVKLGIRMAIRTVGLYLERWGLTPQRPARRAYERDDAAVERWLRIEYPRI
jgi:transposase